MRRKITKARIGHRGVARRKILVDSGEERYHRSSEGHKERERAIGGNE